MPRHTPEYRLQIVVAQFLTYALPADATWTSVDAGAGKMTPSAAELRKRRGVKAGWPDVLVCYAGRLHGVELKAEKGRQSLVQEAVQAELEAAGATYDVVHTIEELETALMGHGIPLKATTGTKFDLARAA